MPKGSSPAPIAERAWRPASPQRATTRSLNRGRGRNGSARAEPDVQVVVVVRERLHAPGRPDEYHLSALGEEPVDELLGQSPVDLRGVPRCPLAPVCARVTDVCVEPVL